MNPKYQIGDKVTGVRSGKMYERLKNSFWFHSNYEKELTIKEVKIDDGSNIYTMNECTGYWMEEWIQPLKFVKVELESDLFEL
jgi:hypothetical protein